MITEEELKDKYSSATIGELVNILVHAGEYIPEAVKAARTELTRRRLDEEDIERHKAQMISEYQVEQLHAASLKLSFGHKVFFYFCWFLPIFLDHALKQNFREDKAGRKLPQASFFKWAGIICLFTAVILSLWLDLQSTTTAAIWVIGFVFSFTVDKKLNC